MDAAIAGDASARDGQLPEAMCEDDDSWTLIKRRLRKSLGDKVFDSFLATIDIDGDARGDVVELSTPTKFLQRWIEHNYQSQLLTAIQAEMPEVRSVVITVRSAERHHEAPAPSRAHETPAAAAQSPGAPLPQIKGSPLNPRLTFETFDEGTSNRLALAAARFAVGPHTSAMQNPLFIHGAVGLGKTHLEQAITQRARATGAQAVYLTAETFLRSPPHLEAAKQIVIDDVQFVCRKVACAALCELLTQSAERGCQVVLAADRHPADSEFLDERTRSRVLGGLVVEIGRPDVVLRRKIVERHLAEARRFLPAIAIAPEILQMVAERIDSNARDLAGAVNRLIARQSVDPEPLTVETAQAAIADLIHARETRHVRVEDIQRAVADHYGVDRRDLLSDRRTQNIVRPRQIAMYLAKVLTPRSLPDIGRRFGGRDHTTVLHAVKKMEAKVANDPGFRDEIGALKRAFAG